MVLRMRRAGGIDRWDVTVFYKRCPRQLAPVPSAIAAGVDLGIRSLAAVVDTTGDQLLLGNPRFLKVAQLHLKAKQRRLATSTSKGLRRRRLVSELAAAHRKVASARRNHLHHVSRRLVDRYQTIVLEDLKVANITRSAKGSDDKPGGNVKAKAGVNRSILDAGWGMLIDMIVYKADEAGRQLKVVSPYQTSQTCAVCGYVDPRNRRDERFSCHSCGHDDHADLNAAANVLKRGGFRPGSGHAAGREAAFRFAHSAEEPQQTLSAVLYQDRLKSARQSRFSAGGVDSVTEEPGVTTGPSLEVFLRHDLHPRFP